MPHWATPYLGWQYRRGAQGPDYWDCWSFFREVQSRNYGRSLPALPAPASHGSIAKAMEPWAADFGWQRVKMPADGDAVFLACLKEPTHVGIWVGDLKSVLHCSRGGTALHTPFHLAAFGWRICGYFRAGT